MTKGMAARAGFFLEFLGSNHKGNGGIQWGRGPCRPGGGRQAPVARWGATAPPFFLKGLRCKFEEKNYTLGLSPYGSATGVYF